MPGIIVERARVVYWPVPKCAMSSLKTAIARDLGVDFDPIEGGPLPLTNESLEGYTDVAIVRHPVERLFSLWWEKIREGASYRDGGLDESIFAKPKGVFRVGMSFEEFVDAVVRIPEPKADEHYAPQTRQVPWGATWYQFEEVRPLLAMLAPRVNVSGSTRAYRDGAVSREVFERLRLHYDHDFRRFGYGLG